MEQLGDITKIDGCDVPAVEVVIGGSPCQDLSIAGKRAGLSGERSGLFMEQIRIIKEMRKRDKQTGRTNIRPRYMVWENVPGAFSSNKGEDFRALLEETAKIACETAVIPRPSDEKWRNSGCIMGDGWSIAWRVLDAQFWGVPQRRRRIALVADFVGQTAPEILFERESVSGDIETCGTEREEATRRVGTNIDRTSYAVRIRGGCDGGRKGALIQTERSGTLGCDNDQTIFCLQGNGIDRADTADCNGCGWRKDVSYTLNTIDRHAVCAGFKGNQGSDAGGIGYEVETAPTITGNQAHVLCLNDQGGDIIGVSRDVCATLRAQEHGHQPCVIDISHRNGSVRQCRDVVPTLCASAGTGENNVPCVHMCTDIGFFQSELDKSPTLLARMYNNPHLVSTAAIVRRSTPLECERLQGYPDGWTDIGEWVDSKGRKRKNADVPRYKALGNSIALPPWRYVLSRLNTYLTEHTMASLFDGIGGFPLIWSELNGDGKCLWASEIEEFPLAVTRVRCGDGQ